MTYVIPDGAAPGGSLRSVAAHLVWDWNGTLLDDSRLIVDASNDVFASVGARPVTFEEYRRRFRRPVSAYYSEVIGRLLDAEEFARLDKLFHESYRARLPEQPLTAGALAAVREWHGAGRTQSVLSMFRHDELVPLVERFGLTRYFRRVDGLPVATGGGDPKAAYLASHLAALELAGDACVLVGDSLDDAAAARAAGVRCVLFGGGLNDPDQLRGTGFPVVDTLADAVARASSI